MKIDLRSTNLVKDDTNIRYTDFDFHPSQVAWRDSRPDAEKIRLAEVLELDLPVNEIPMVTIFVQSTILEREIFTSMRNHVIWAQTSRVQNVLEFSYPDSVSVETKAVYELIRKHMREAKENGVRQDEYRRILPALSNTKYTLNISMRDLISVFREFVFLSIKCESSEMRSILSRSSNTISTFIMNHFHISGEALMKYKPKPVLNDITSNKSGSLGGVVIVSSRLPLTLRAQLVRHRRLIVRDNLKQLIISKDAHLLTNDSTIDVQVIGTEEDWTDVVRKRSCWIAHYNLWSPLLNKVEEQLNLGQESLPCHDGKCPYDGDAKARYTDEDPNAPCPIHARLTGRSLTTKQLEEMQKQWESDERPMFWIHETQKFQHGGE